MAQKVLAIDDSPTILTLLRTRLKDEKIELHCAESGRDGLSLAAQVKPDLILLDVDMPDLNGHDVCRELKSHPETNSTLIIFLTGADSVEEKIKGLELGATDYITKPFDPAELRARVRAALRTAYLMDLLARKAMIDSLTGLWNRSYLDVRLQSEAAHARRTGQPLSCLMVDVDRFKSINDRYGHPFGDEVLRMIAMTLGINCRTEDVICRYGGEEFSVLLPNTSAACATELAERLRVAVEREKLSFRTAVVQVTASIGVAEFDTRTPPSMIERADEALYEAKESGRNRVCIAGLARV